MSHEPDPLLLAYFFAQEKARHERVEAAWATLTEREQQLVRDAAVLGFVRGSAFGRHQTSARPSDGFPGDAEIVREVLEFAETTASGFRMLGAAFAGHRPETGAEAEAIGRGEDPGGECCPACRESMIRVRPDEDGYAWRCERCRENWPGGL